MNKKRLLIIVGIVAAAVLLSILFYTMLANHPPAITSLEAESERVLPRGSCQIAYNASDPDGDELSYNWSANGGEITGEGATVTWTAPYFQGSYNITLTVSDGRGGEDTDYVIITVRANWPPTITSLIADADWTLPSGSLQVTCDASDPDDDELSYEWTASGGDISGTGPEVIWTAPQEVGTCNVTVVVTDGYGGSDTRTLPVTVVTGQPPIIENLIITADHCYLKKYSGGYYVGMEQMYDIECIVSDTSIELSYVWSCTGGEISEVSEDGSMIGWAAPDDSGKVTITVIVSDIAGNTASKNLVLNVVSCSPCTFGC